MFFLESSIHKKFPTFNGSLKTINVSNFYLDKIVSKSWICSQSFATYFGITLYKQLHIPV